MLDLLLDVRPIQRAFRDEPSRPLLSGERADPVERLGIRRCAEIFPDDVEIEGEGGRAGDIDRIGR
ncbi:hypothetical protein [Bradyrhizobium sp. Gha]|uniref:hypothetical protein n=1 Tax=Bradyrhizobium sp. Gha TaxID=1855318 RepID=UPI0015A51DEE|nr:hypothetical protein [Bradyrhizobium sp. Gha]